MNNAEYEMEEARRFHKEMQEAEHGSLPERREAAREFAKEMAVEHGRERIGENLSHLLSGNYGYGAMKAAQKILKAGGRTNKKAALMHIVAAIGYKCPGRACVAAWKKLSPSDKKALDAVLDREIADGIAYMKESGGW